MALLHAALLKLKRGDFAGPSELVPCPLETPVDGPVFSIFEQAKKQLNRSASKRFGFFDPNAENKQLPGLIKNFRHEQFNFLAWANKAAAFLQQQIEPSDTPINCSVLFAEESILEQHYLYCFMLPMTEVIQTSEDMQPYYSEAIEAHKLQFALRVHVEQFLDDGSPKYLTQILSRGAKDLSDGFSNFSNFSEGIDIGAQTKEFLQIVEDYSDEMEEDVAKKFKSQVIDYCVDQDKIGVPVLLEEISEQLDAEKPAAFAEYVTGAQQQANNEIHTDRASLKRYMRYFGRDNSLSISFSADRFGSDIQYDPTAGSLKISKLPKSLKAQLSGHFDKTEEH